ncbi:MAG: sialidase family protein [Thermoplasmatota archaeon]
MFAEGAEPYIAVDPANANHAVAVAMTNVAPYESPWLEYATTFDAGRTWVHGYPGGSPATPADLATDYNFAADVMVAFGVNGTPDISALVGHELPPFSCFNASILGAACPTALSPATVFLLDLAVWPSSDGGRTFPSPVIVEHGTGTFAYTNAAHARFGILDRDLLAADPVTGALYVGYSVRGNQTSAEEVGGADTFYVARSLDGRTWSGPVRVTDDSAYGVSIAAYNGSVLVSYQDDANATSVWQVARSADGGRTWRDATTLGPRGHDYVSSVAWFNHPGKPWALAAWIDNSSNASIVISLSRDGGATWDAKWGRIAIVGTQNQLVATGIDARTGQGIIAVTAPRGDALAIEVAPFVNGSVGPTSLVNGSGFPVIDTFDYFGAAAEAGRVFLVFPQAPYGIDFARPDI